MRTLLILAAILLTTGTAANARPLHHRLHHRQHVHTPVDANGNGITAREAELGRERSYCNTDTAAGPIIIACDLADKMTGFIADVVARGFKGRVHCFSLSRAHVAGSTHFLARGCDFAQRGWNKTVSVMYRVGDLAAKWGLRDGCSFRHPRKDCGHIDGGGEYARRKIRHGSRA